MEPLISYVGMVTIGIVQGRMGEVWLQSQDTLVLILARRVSNPPSSVCMVEAERPAQVQLHGPKTVVKFGLQVADDPLEIGALGQAI